jgi:superfamily II DNA or RNA helicase
MNQSYIEFLKAKKIVDTPTGFIVEESALNPMLFDFQKAIVAWACKRGRAAIFADCGLGKTPMQLEWARLVCEQTGGNVLIVAPLAVSQQTRREGEKFNIPVNICREQADVKPGINITNYEILHKFDASSFSGVVLDESSILKSIVGKIKSKLIEDFKNTQYKLACTATPSPNDLVELGNHSEFLSVMNSTTMLSLFFYNDGTESQKWHIKGHAEKEYWRWVSSWAVCISKPSDIGFDDGAFTLPPMNIIEHVLDVDMTDGAEGQLFRSIGTSAIEYHKEKRISSKTRAQKCADISSLDSGSQWLIWCDTNYDAESLKASLPKAVEVRGNDTDEKKINSATGFKDGTINVLISKPKIFGFGMNFQQCHNMIFCGMSYSYESFYQASRRIWRFGQDKPVTIHVVVSETEQSILGAIKEKEKQFKYMKEEMATAMSEYQEVTKRVEPEISTGVKTIESGDAWTLINADCVIAAQNIESDSIGLSIFSPPFASLYTYSDSPNDMGNCVGTSDFYDHFKFLIRELYRITIPGRDCSFHCMNLPTIKSRDGYIGIRDFRGELIRLFVDEGWIYHSEVTIWKDPVVAMQRTKALGLLHKQIKKDAARCRQGIPDYLVTMRKPGENDCPVTNDNHSFPVEKWQKWASPVWMDIRQSNTLQKERDEKDEKHICVLQLDVIERCLTLWSNPGDTIFSPFAGIGSEGYQSVLLGRKFIGIELKESYFNQAVANLKTAENKFKDSKQDLISIMEA